MIARGQVWLRVLLVAPMVLLPLVAACSSEKDTRYRDSIQLAPLALPAGLDTPAYTQTMEIPASAPRSGQEGQDEGIDIEKPPTLVKSQ